MAMRDFGVERQVKDYVDGAERFLSGRRIFAIFVAIVLIFGTVTSGYLFENVDADEICVIQDAVDGELHVYFTPGVKAQLFGKVTKYPKRAAFASEEEMRFNDGAKAKVDVSIQYEYPTNEQAMTRIHTTFGSHESAEAALVGKVVGKAVYYTGPLMSSQQSYAEKRNDLIWFVEDQVKHGVYRTKQKDVRVEDEITKEWKTVTLVEVVKTDKGDPERQEEAVLTGFQITPFNLALKIHYEPEVEAQIAAQQKAIMDVQLAVAESKKAEQRAKTVEKQGEATAAEARWKQEAIKAQAVTQAQQEKEVAETAAAQRFEVAKREGEQKLQVATLAAQEAEQYKLQKIRQAEGDATYKQKVLEADGALQQKLATYETVAKAFAAALGQYNGSLVPAVVMASTSSSGGTGGAGASGMTAMADMMSVLTAKAAKDLALDLGVPSKRQ